MGPPGGPCRGRERSAPSRGLGTERRNRRGRGLSMMVAVVVVFSRRGKERRNGRREEEEKDVSRRKIKRRGEADSSNDKSKKKKTLSHTLSLSHTHIRTHTHHKRLAASSIRSCRLRCLRRTCLRAWREATWHPLRPASRLPWPKAAGLLLPGVPVLVQVVSNDRFDFGVSLRGVR